MPLVELADVHKRFGTLRCSTASRSTSSRARSSPSSAAPARARARCCAASTGWSRSRPAASWSTASWSTTRHRSAQAAPARRHRVPELQPLPASHGRAQHHAGAQGREGHAARGGAAARRGRAAQGRAGRTSSTPIPTSSRAASSSASRSPARSPCSPTLMLFDEITSALDPELVGEVLSVLEDMAATA